MRSSRVPRRRHESAERPQLERLRYHSARWALLLGVALVTRLDRKSTRLNSSHIQKSRMPSSA